MRSVHRAGCIALVVAVSTCALGAGAPPAAAFNPLRPICGAAGLLSGIAGKACHALQHPGQLANAGKKLITGHPGAALKALAGSSAASATTALGLAAIVTWVVGGAKSALHLTATVLAETTSPRLGSTWFSSAYWRMAAVAAVLTLPFLFAAAVQALLASDLALLARAALGYLPLAMLAISVAAPVTMLLLAASDELSGIVSAAAGNHGGSFLAWTGGFAGALSIGARSPFIVFLIGLFTAASAIVLWLELAVREAAVYVVVLMLPLAFAALVWPARRVWAVRAVELLVALILSKFAIVAVLALGGAALDRASSGVTAMVAGAALVAMAAFAPWATLRLVPLSELASGTAGALRPGAAATIRPLLHATDSATHAASGWAEAMAAGARDMAPSDPAAGEAHSAASSQAQRPPEPLGPRVAGSAGSPATTTAVGPPREAGAPPEAGAPSVSGPDGDEEATVLPGTTTTPAPDLDSATPATSPDGRQAPAGADPSRAPAERLPGTPPMRQAPYMSGTPLTLGVEGWPLPRLGPPEGRGEGQEDRTAEDPVDRTADDHDPRPPKQRPEEGAI